MNINIDFNKMRQWHENINGKLPIILVWMNMKCYGWHMPKD